MSLQISHSIDLPMWLTDNYDVQSVRGVTFDRMKNHTEGNALGAWDPDHFDVEDSFMAMITMKNGMLIYVECAWVINMLQEAPGMTAAIAGTKAGADMVGPGFENHVRVNEIVSWVPATPASCMPSRMAANPQSFRSRLQRSSA